MKHQKSFIVKPSEIEEKLGKDWSFLKDKSALAPESLIFVRDRPNLFGQLITWFMAFLAMALGGLLTYTQFVLENLNYWFLIFSLETIAWGFWKVWQLFPYFFGKIPRKYLGFCLGKEYLVQIITKRKILSFPKSNISKITFKSKHTINTQQAKIENYFIEIHTKLGVKPYRYKLNMINTSHFIQILEKENIRISFLK